MVPVVDQDIDPAELAHVLVCHPRDWRAPRTVADHESCARCGERGRVSATLAPGRARGHHDLVAEMAADAAEFADASWRMCRGVSDVGNVSFVFVAASPAGSAMRVFVYFCCTIRLSWPTALDSTLM